MHRLPKLLRDNADRPRNFSVQAKGDEIELFLYDIIGEDFWTGEGVTAAKFLDAIKGHAGTVHLRINSPGGDVFEARAIVSAMQRSTARFVAHVDALAASAASVIAVAADEVVMAPGSMLMIHNAWTMAVGDKHAMLDTAGLLEKIDGTIADQYAEKTGMDRADIASMMDAETWITAEDAVAQRFADRLEEKAAKPANAWNLSAYTKAPVTNSAQPDLNDAEVEFCTAMIEHHQIALDMVDAVYPQIESPEVKALSDEIITAQAGEIALMNRWVSPPEGASAGKKKPMKMSATNTADADHAHRLRLAAIAAIEPA